MRTDTEGAAENGLGAAYRSNYAKATTGAPVIVIDYRCVQIIANLAVLLSPFLPFSSEKVCKWLGIDNKWEKQSIPAGYLLPEVEILFQRIDKKVIETETEKQVGSGNKGN